MLNKPWNPYIRRHTALTEKSLNPKIAHILNQHAGWTQGSAMREKYLHYFSNTSSESILEAYGIVPSDKKQSDILKPKSCPHCQEPNQPNSKFCIKCRMVLTFDSHAETLELEKKKDEQLELLTRQIFDLNRNQEQLEQDMANIAMGKPIQKRQLSKEEEEELYQLVKEDKDIVKVQEDEEKITFQVRSLI